MDLSACSGSSANQSINVTSTPTPRRRINLFSNSSQSISFVDMSSIPTPRACITTSISLSMRFTVNPANRIDSNPNISEEKSSEKLLFRRIKKKLHPLPPFSGDVEDWWLFEASSVKSTETSQYSNLENNMRLVECLKGKAEEAVEILLIHPKNVEEVTKKLKFEFGRTELLVKYQFEKFRKVQPVQNIST
uniref:Uncharacterized protein n=1 Tax=Megaselia scalaris TaxID=36166 RepID=T1GZ64_MEGSC